MVKEIRKNFSTNKFFKKTLTTWLISPMISVALFFSSSCSDRTSYLRESEHHTQLTKFDAANKEVQIPPTKKIYSALPIDEYLIIFKSKLLFEQIDILFGTSSSLSITNVYDLKVSNHAQSSIIVRVTLNLGHIFKNSNEIVNCRMTSENNCYFSVNYVRIFDVDKFKNMTIGAYCCFQSVNDYQNYFQDLPLDQKLRLINAPLLINKNIIQSVDAIKKHATYGYEVVLNDGIGFSSENRFLSSYFFEFNGYQPNVGKITNIIPFPASQTNVINRLPIQDFFNQNFSKPLVDKDYVEITNSVEINKFINFFRTLNYKGGWANLYGLSNNQIEKFIATINHDDSLIDLQIYLHQTTSKEKGYYFANGYSHWNTKINYSQLITPNYDVFYNTILLANNQTINNFIEKFNNLKLSDKLTYIVKKLDSTNKYNNALVTVNAADKQSSVVVMLKHDCYLDKFGNKTHIITLPFSFLPFDVWSSIMTNFINPQMREYSSSELQRLKIQDWTVDQLNFSTFNRNLWHFNFAHVEKNLSQPLEWSLCLENINLIGKDSLFFNVGFNAYTDNFKQDLLLNLRSNSCLLNGVNHFTEIVENFDVYTSITNKLAKLIDQLLELLLTGTLVSNKNNNSNQSEIPFVNLKIIFQDLGPLITELVVKSNSQVFSQLQQFLIPVSHNLNVELLIKIFNNIFANKSLGSILCQSLKNIVRPTNINSAIKFVASIPILGQKAITHTLASSLVVKVFNSLFFSTVGEWLELISDELTKFVKVTDIFSRDPIFFELLLNFNLDVGVLDELGGIFAILISEIIAEKSINSELRNALININNILYPLPSELLTFNKLDHELGISFDLNACVYRNITNARVFLETLMYGLWNISNNNDLLSRLLNLSLPPRYKVTFKIGNTNLNALKKMGFIFSCDAINKQVKFLYHPDDNDPSIKITFGDSFTNSAFVLRSCDLQNNYGWLGSEQYSGGLFSINIYDLIGNADFYENIFLILKCQNPNKKHIFAAISKLFKKLNITPQSVFNLFNSIFTRVETCCFHDVPIWCFCQSITNSKNSTVRLEYISFFKEIHYERIYTFISPEGTSIRIDLKSFKSLLDKSTINDLCTFLTSLGSMRCDNLFFIGKFRLADFLNNDLIVPHNLTFSQNVLLALHEDDIIPNAKVTVGISLVGMNWFFDNIFGLNLSGNNLDNKSIFNFRLKIFTSYFTKFLFSDLVLDNTKKNYTFTTIQKVFTIFDYQN